MPPKKHSSSKKKHRNENKNMGDAGVQLPSSYQNNLVDCRTPQKTMTKYLNQTRSSDPSHQTYQREFLRITFKIRLERSQAQNTSKDTDKNGADALSSKTIMQIFFFIRHLYQGSRMGLRFELRDQSRAPRETMVE